MKTIKHELRYEGATIDQVHEMLADPAFREEVCRRQHVLRQNITITPHGGGVEAMDVRVDQVQAARGLPSVATKLVGDEINIVQEEAWSTKDRADLSIAIPGKPGDILGSITLVETGGGVTETVDLTVKIKVPLVGGKLESLVSDMLVKAFETENKVGSERLSR